MSCAHCWPKGEKWLDQDRLVDVCGWVQLQSFMWFIFALSLYVSVRYRGSG